MPSQQTSKKTKATKLQGIGKPNSFKKKGASSNTYLHMLINAAPMTPASTAELADLIKNSHRITPVSTKKAAQGKTVFNAATGYHEWIPTDQAIPIVEARNSIWSGLYTSLRSPTWLLIVRPDKYCTNSQHAQQLATAIALAEANSPATINASDLGLVGHSGGLNIAGTDQTTFQSTWHDRLREIFERHLPGNTYDQYWIDLQQFFEDNFLFYSDTSFPGTTGHTVPSDDILKRISWDMYISGRGNPPGLTTLYDVAIYLRAQWAENAQLLANGFRAYRYFTT